MEVDVVALVEETVRNTRQLHAQHLTRVQGDLSRVGTHYTQYELHEEVSRVVGQALVLPLLHS